MLSYGLQGRRLLCCVNSVADVDGLQFQRLPPEVGDEVPITVTTVLIQRNCETNLIVEVSLFRLCAFSQTEIPNFKQNAKIYAFMCRLLSIFFFSNISQGNVCKKQSCPIHAVTADRRCSYVSPLKLTLGDRRRSVFKVTLLPKLSYVAK